MKKYLLLLTLLFSIGSFAQQRIDRTLSFQTDPAKKYSIYVPSGYIDGTPHKMMLGLHPWNTSRWDAKSWCDTLIVFAETNNLLLICPDGGADGQVDDPIDTAFTSAILDSMETWYSVNTDKVYAMGFSWGGKTTYTYGLGNNRRFGGYIPIGAAVNGAGDISGVVANSTDEAFYVIHGSSDAPGIRFNPLINSLNLNNAIVESQLLQGVGHTIDFANRNSILNRAFFWVDSVNCEQLSSISLGEEEYFKSLNAFPNPAKSGTQIEVEIPEIKNSSYNVSIRGIDGKEVWQNNILPTLSSSSIVFTLPTLNSGSYIVVVQNENNRYRAMINIK
jgi:predicted esterase